jgi:hypothetical protein
MEPNVSADKKYHEFYVVYAVLCLISVSETNTFTRFENNAKKRQTLDGVGDFVVGNSSILLSFLLSLWLCP